MHRSRGRQHRLREGEEKAFHVLHVLSSLGGTRAIHTVGTGGIQSIFRYRAHFDAEHTSMEREVKDSNQAASAHVIT